MIERGIGCGGCSGCQDGSRCVPYRGKLLKYDGLRFTADGFDCALPVSLDSHNTCSFRCMYCFSNNLMRDPNRKLADQRGQSAFLVGQQSLAVLERILSGGFSSQTRLGKIYKTLHSTVKKAGDKRICPIQVGALGDPLDNVERQQGWLLRAIPIFNKHEQPVRISTKGADVALRPEYLRAFAMRPELYWVAWSCISIDDEMLAKVDVDAPSATQRLRAMKALSKLGVKNSLRMRPMLPGISDSTPKHPKAWRDLLRAGREAGAIALSMEFAFVPGVRPSHIQSMWKQVEQATDIPLVEHYIKTSSTYGNCLRSSRAWKEDLTLAIYEECKKLGMHFGCSDPHWKELNDFGCCCGIPPDDPVFGAWQHEQATDALVRARQGAERGEKVLVSAKDGIPWWAGQILLDEMTCQAGRKNTHSRRLLRWEDKLRDTWNDLHGARGPLQYFEGVLWPVRRSAAGDIEYEYRPPQHRDRKKPLLYWRV